MSNVDMLGRRLDAEGCLIAGTQLETAVRDLGAKDEIELVKEVQAGVTRVVDCAGVLRELCPSVRGDGTMVRFDRVTDRNVAAFVRALRAVEIAFEPTDMLPPTDEELARAQQAAKAKNAIAPTGTGFLKLPFQLQWVRLQDVASATIKHKTEIESIGLWMQAQRTLRFIDEYGKRLGLTDSSPEKRDRIAIAIMQWHEGWADLSVDVRSYYRDGKHPRAAHVRTQLLSAYEGQVQRLRDADRKKRTRKGSEDDTEDDE
jgi:hypothetical protein